MKKIQNNNMPLILVSNREPYVHEKSEGKIITKRSFGGLVTALDPLMQKNGGMWVAWGSGAADFECCDKENKLLIPPNQESYTLKRIPLSPDEEDQYYKGYANSVLWPLFHIFIDKIEVDEEYWNTYVKVNQRFADAIIEEMDEQYYIWIHDYHLALVPQFIKEIHPKAKISFFWHIPWPPWEIYGTLPQREEILKGLLHTDLIGFHTNSYVSNFLDCCNHLSDASIKNSIVSHQNQNTKIFSNPLGINYSSYSSESLHSDKIEKQKKILRNAHDVDSIILGIDRLDYTKGILNRLRAYEYFLEKYPQFHRNVVLIQIATPSRYEIDEYHNIKKDIDETVGRINGKYRTPDWTPVEYFYRRIPQHLLLAYYQVSDIALLTPIRDGMNLIAKEYIAARKNHAVLILSEFAGASEELNEAIIVNPYDICSTAEALKTAVTMPIEEKINRFKELKKKVKKYDSSYWLTQFLNNWNEQYKTR